MFIYVINKYLTHNYVCFMFCIFEHDFFSLNIFHLSPLVCTELHDIVKQRKQLLRVRDNVSESRVLECFVLHVS